MEQLEGPPPPAAPPPPPPPPQKCPRCDSSNTKFCYYNNYSLSQPRYFCKACRRYWTRGGTLRNVPGGGGCRRSRTKRPKLSPSNPPGISHPFSAAPPVGYNGNNHPFYGGGGGAFMSFYSGAGDNMAFLQSIRSDDRDDLIIPSQEFVLSMNPGTTTSWTQSFIRSSPGPSISSWSRAAGDGEHHSAGLYSFDRNRAGLD